MTTNDRRVSRRALVAGLSAAGLAAAAPVERLFAATAPLPARGPWDLSWLDSLDGKHRQLFDIGSIKDGNPLHAVNNWYEAHEEVFNLQPSDLSAVVGIAFRAFPINASDALWKKYELGRHWELPGREPKTWLNFNRFDRAERSSPQFGDTVTSLRERGAIFWQCNNALNGVVGMLASMTGQSVEAVRSEVVAGLNPGVKIVPAHVMLVGLAQERGCAYEHL